MRLRLTLFGGLVVAFALMIGLRARAQPYGGDESSGENSTVQQAASVAISEVLYDPAGDDGGQQRIELWNFGDTTADLGGYQLCASFSYFGFPAGVTIPPGKVIIVHVDEAGEDTGTDIYTGASFRALPLESDFGLYMSGSFTDPTQMVDFVQWGGNGIGRESVAVSAGIWTSGDFVPSVPEGHSIAYDGDGDAASDWFDQETPGLGLPPGTDAIAVEAIAWAKIKALFGEGAR